MADTNIKDLEDNLRRTVQLMGDYPDDVKISRHEKDGGVVHFSVTTHKRDIGRTVGTHGRHVNALRKVYQAIGRRIGIKRVEITIEQH